MSVSQHNGVQLVVLFCSSIPVVLFDNPGISKCHNTLFLLSPHLCFTIGFICDLSVARNGSWMSKIPPHGPNRYMFLPLWRLRAGVGTSLKLA